MYDATHHFPHTHCSQTILEDFFFLSSTSLFSLDPYLCTPQARVLEMWRGVVKGDWVPLTGDEPRIDTNRQIEPRKIGNGVKRQVREIKRDTHHGSLPRMTCTNSPSVTIRRTS